METTGFKLLRQGSRGCKVALARNLRARMTPAEQVFWSRIRFDQVRGLRFRRQVVIAGYIADFYCSELRLVIEVDGPVHETQKAYDQRRDFIMNARGLRVVRLSNDEVLTDVESALHRALQEAGAPA